MNRIVTVLITVVILLGIIGGGFFAFKQLSKPPQQAERGNETVDEVKELALEDRPYTTLVPGPSCEYTFTVSKIKNSPVSVEYEIVYKNGDGVTQGATGTLKPSGSSSVTKKILFGSESSGKRRCDPGVSGGSITLRYRDSDGKLKSKIASNFAQVEDSSSLSVDTITVNLGKAVKGKYLVMGTMGIPGAAPGKVTEGPYGVFTNVSTPVVPTITITGSGDLYAWVGSWAKVTNNKPSNLSALILSQ